VLSCKCNCTSGAFTWKSANYGGSVEVVYTVEIDKKGKVFKTPVVLASRKLKTKHQFQLKL
jgi:hypothetical protein